MSVDQTNRGRAAIQLAERDADQHDLSLRGLESHQAVLDALVAQEPERAAALLRRDIEVFLEAATSPAMQRAFEQLSAVP